MVQSLRFFYLVQQGLIGLGFKGREGVLSCRNLLGQASKSSIQAFASGSSRTHWAIQTFFIFSFTRRNQDSVFLLKIFWQKWISFLFHAHKTKTKRLHTKNFGGTKKIHPRRTKFSEKQKKSLINPTNKFQPTRNHKKPFWLDQNFAFRPNLELLPITQQLSLLTSWVSCLTATHPAHRNQ